MQATTNLVTAGSIWTDIPPPYQTNGANPQFLEPSPAGNKFYRLHKPWGETGSTKLEIRNKPKTQNNKP